MKSYDELPNAPIISRNSTDFFMGESDPMSSYYLSDTWITMNIECYACKDESDLRRSPLLAPSHANLPSAVIQVCGNDPLRDEGILYADVLKEGGADVKLTMSVRPLALQTSTLG